MQSRIRTPEHLGTGYVLGYSALVSKTYTQSSAESIECFRRFVKEPLQSLLGGEVFSVEDEAGSGSPIARMLDRAASSDLLLRYQANGAIFTAASRIYFETPEKCRHFCISLTLRNSVRQSYQRTELNKLHAAISLFRNGIPVVLPRFLCFARLIPKIAPTAMHDLLIVETIPLIEHVFCPTKLNLPGLRRRMEVERSPTVLVEPALKHLAGLRTKEENTFLFISKEYLDHFGLPYSYLAC